MFSCLGGPLIVAVFNATATKKTKDKILSLGDGRVCHSSFDLQSKGHCIFRLSFQWSRMQTSPFPFCQTLYLIYIHYLLSDKTSCLE